MIANEAPTGPRAESLLRAGALLPVDSGIKAEPVSARVYRHPALGDRRVVRLVPDAIGAADDLALETLDFALDDVRGPVGLGRPRGLGFPASAILADPPNARYALGVVKEMERLGRMARTKPGNAKDGFDEIGQRLAQTVPHFLPSFFEGAGRAFLEAGAAGQAAAAFGRAREAERTYSLPVDESQRRQSFLEFALAGALTAKALSEYARELVRARAPADAHAALKELCVQRTLGGLPPWTGMAAELRRTAKAAGLDVAAEEAEVLRRLVEAPATLKAAAGFWEGYRPALVRIARDDAAFRGALLNLHPTPAEGSAGFVDWWIALLRDAGALDALLQPDGAPESALPLGGPRAWLERTARQAGAGYSWRVTPPATRLLALVADLAAGIRRDGEPVQLFVGGRVDVDLLDAALAAGIEVAEPEAGPYGVHIDLRSYVVRADRRPLVALGAAPQFAAAVDRAVARTIGEHADRLAELPGLRDALRRWLRSQLDRCARGTLVTLADAVNELERGATERVRALDADVSRAIAATDVAATLARTLRGGLLAEVGWPALDDARVDLPTSQVAGVAWPALIVADARRVVAVGPQAMLQEHDLRVPAGTPTWGRSRVLLANGQFFIGWRGREREGYWSGRAGDVFEPRGELGGTFVGWSLGIETSLELDDGARFEGAAPVRAGDTTTAAPRKVVSDGLTTWVLTEVGTALREADPSTGRLGRSSLPQFFEDFVAEGWTLDLKASWLMPLPAGADAAVIGERDGLIGFRVRRRNVDGGTEWEIEGVDGRRFRGAIGETQSTGLMAGSIPVALVVLPGDESPRPVSSAAHGNWITVWDAEGRHPLVRLASGPSGKPASARPFESDTHELADGVPFVAPPLFWFALRPRQVEASRALRSITDADARRLLDAASDDLARDGGGRHRTATDRVLSAILPVATDERLRAGIAGAAILAGRFAKRLAKMDLAEPAASRRPDAAAPTAAVLESVPRVVNDPALRDALAGLLIGPGYSYGSASGRPLEQLATVASVMDGTRAPGGLRRLFGGGRPLAPITLPESSVPWYETIGRFGALAFRAAVPTTKDEDRSTLVAFLEAAARHRYPSRASNIRLLTIAKKAQGEGGGQELAWNGDRTLFVTAAGWTTTERRLSGFEYARNGRFQLDKDTSLVHEVRPGSGWGDETAIERFLGELERRGPLPWDPGAVDVLQAHTGLSRAAAALLLATLPSIDSREVNFLPPAIREVLDVKAADARAARDQLRSLTAAQRLAILDSAMPPDPADLWRTGLAGAAERIAVAWVTLRGRRAVIDDAALAAAARELAFTGSPLDPLHLLAEPNDPRLRNEPPAVVESGWSAPPDARNAFSGEVARTLAIALPWAHVNLAAGDPILEALPRALAAVRERLASPTLVLPLQWVQWPDADRGLAALGARPWNAPRGATVVGSALEIGAIVAAGSSQNELRRLYLRPALMDQGVPESIIALLGPDGLALLESARFLRGNGAGAIAGRAASTPLPPGSWEADPSASAPEVLAAAAEALGLAPDAARLFLELLALPAPTKASIQRSNDWSTAAWNRAASPLVDAGLVVRGTRPRAGRDLFLGGPWVQLPTPDLPVERWKLPLYRAHMLADGSVRKPLDRLLPLQPLHELFAIAWTRWEQGDRPDFDTLPARR